MRREAERESHVYSIQYTALLGHTAPPGDIGGTNPGIMTTTLLTREHLQLAISGSISGLINILSSEIFLINPLIFHEIFLNASLKMFVRKYYQSGRSEALTCIRI